VSANASDTTSDRNWVTDAEAALRGEEVDDVEVLAGQRPPLLDAFARRALLTPFMAAFLWAAVVFREALRHPLEPVALVLRLLALAMTLRALLLLGMLARRGLLALRRTRYALALTADGLLYRTPDADFAVAKEDVIDVREPGDWRERGGARWADVFLITRPSTGRLCLAFPPVLERTPGTLAERLMRWRGVVPAPEGVPEREPSSLPSKLFDEVAAGRVPEGVVAIRQGRGWLHRAPFATVLLGIALLDGYLRLAPPLRARLSVLAPAVAVACLVLVPLGWLLVTRSQMARQKGVALVLTPAELLLRTRAGVVRVAYAQLAKLEITSRNAWTILRGTHEARTLVLHRKQDDSIHYAEAYLGQPAEVVLALCEAYRKGVLP